MRRLLGPTAPCVDVKSLSCVLWLRRRKLHISITVEGFGFGNPPYFPHKYFAACEEINLHVAVSLSDLSAVLHHYYKVLRHNYKPLISPALGSVPVKFPWDPVAYEKNTKFKLHWRDYYVGLLHV